MIHKEIRNRQLIILDYDLDGIHYANKRVPLLLSYKAAVILEKLKDGTYLTLKNIEGNPGVIVTQKEVTKFMLKYGL